MALLSSIDEQRILVVFNSKALSNLNSLPPDLGEDIGLCAKQAKLFGFLDSIKVALVQSNIKNTEASILIILPDSKKTDFGVQVHSFKKKLIGVFSDAGVSLQLSDIEFTYEDEDTISELLAKFKSKGSKKVASREDNTSVVSDEYDYEEKAKQFVPVDPLFSFDRVILPSEVKEKLEQAIAILQYEDKVFNEWGLYEIQPHPSTSLSFFGPSGTGKTMAAEAVAQKLGKKILKVSYADVESKYHGEGPKMVKAIFLAAQKADAVLFFDEADSLLSKRLTNVSQGSEQAINSMRSQLLICLEEYRGIVIFATNLVINYDKAFLTRLISIEFPIPDKETRKVIWDVHIRPLNDGNVHRLNIPLAPDVDTRELALKYEFVGREIRNAVINACISVAMAQKNIVNQSDLVASCESILKERQSLENARDHTQGDLGQKILKAAIMSNKNIEVSE